MSDVEWKKNMQSAMFPSYKDNIYHRGELSKIEPQIAMLTNGFIANDECHIASGKNMTMSQMIKRVGITNVDYARQKKLKILQVSATPDSVLWDLKAWGANARVVKLKTGQSYKGFRTMLNESRIQPMPKFKNIQDVRIFFQSWENRYATCPTKKYFPIRLLKKSVDLMGWFKTIALECRWDTVQYDSGEKIDIDNKMKHAPENHTIIFVKDYWRASKRIERIHVGGCLEEPPGLRNVTSTSQGLIARLCNTYEYEEEELQHPEWKPLHFGDVEAINMYMKWYESGCDYKSSNYSSTTLKSKGGRVKSTPSALHHTNTIGLGAEDIEGAEHASLSESALLASPLHTTREEADRWATENINFQHVDLLNRNTCNGRARRVEEYNSDGTRNSERRGTHMKDRGTFIEIQTAEMILSGQNINQQGGGGVRSIPVRMGGDEINKYAIIYRESWLKP